MKYTLLTIIFLSSLFHSCKSDTDDLYIIPETGPKTKKIIHNVKLTKTVGIDSKFDPIYETFTYEFFYENGQVTKLANTEMNDYSVFNYDKDNKITKMINYSNNTIFNTINFYYTNNLLTSSVTTENENVINSRNEYNYNTQGLLTSSESLTGSITNTKQYTYYSTKNLESITNIESNYKSVYKYDQKINPFRGYNPYFKIINNNLIYNTLSNNNPSIEEIYSDSNLVDKTIIYDITYDNENYPINIIGKDAVTGRIWNSYVFNYQTIIAP